MAGRKTVLRTGTAKGKRVNSSQAERMRESGGLDTAGERVVATLVKGSTGGSTLALCGEF